MRYAQNIDLYGLKAELRTFGSKTFKTWLGGVLTLLTILMTAATSFLFGQDFWFKANPKVVLGEVVPEKSELIFPTSVNFTILFRLENDFGNRTIDPENLLIPSFHYYHYKKNEEKQWRKKILFSSSGTRCSETAAVNNPELSNLDLTQFNCINWEDIASRGESEGEEPYRPVLGGTWEENEIGYFSMGVNNSFIEEEGNKTFNDYNKVKYFVTQRNKYLSIYYPESLFDGSNLDKPLNKYWKNYFFRVNHKIAKSERFFFSLVKLEDDLGWIFKDVSNSFALTQSSRQLEMNLVEDPGEEKIDIYFYNLVFYLERSQQTIKRSYMKIQELGAMLGGFVKAVQLIFGFLSSKYAFYRRTVYVFDKLNSGLVATKNLNQTKSMTLTNNYINNIMKKDKKELKISYFSVLFHFCLKNSKQYEHFKHFDSSVKDRTDIQTLFSLTDRVSSLEKKIRG